jgi:hypothetical protein
VTHYNYNMPTDNGKLPITSLEIKWSTIKHNIINFIGDYKQMLSCRESNTLLDNVL